MRIRIIDASEIELDAHIELLANAFRDSPMASSIRETFAKEFYRWKYFTPFGRAIVATAMDGARQTACVAALPMQFIGPTGPRKGWQITDIATLPSERGRGLFRQCLGTLVASVSGDTIICFPNFLSRKGIEAEEFKLSSEIHTYVKALTPNVLPIDLASMDVLAASVPPVYGTHPASFSVMRSPEFINWRYRLNPTFRYRQVITTSGHAIFRPFKLFGANVAIIMELEASEPNRLMRVLHKTERTAAAEGMRACFMMTSALEFSAWRRGYVKIPATLLPKRQLLFVRNPIPSDAEVPWTTSIGDWDGL